MSNAAGEVTSKEVTVAKEKPAEPTTLTAPTIKTEPEDAYGTTGQTVSFTVVAEGEELSYQWMVNTGSGFKPTTAAGCDSPTFSFKIASSKYYNYSWKCVVSNAAGEVTSKEVTKRLPWLNLLLRLQSRRSLRMLTVRQARRYPSLWKPKAKSSAISGWSTPGPDSSPPPLPVVTLPHSRSRLRRANTTTIPGNAL